jgi:hypothetical protein
MKRFPNSLIPTIGASFILMAILACNVSVPSRGQIEGSIATAQAAGAQISQLATNAAPTINALKTQGADLVENAGPTLIALQTQAVELATRAAPTIESGIAMAQTAVADTQDRAGQAKATLDAAGIDGQYLWHQAQSVVPDENGNVLITFTETELNLALNAHLLLKKQEGEAPPLENMRIRISDGLLYLEGRLENPVSTNITLLVQPFVQNGDLAINIISADANGYSLPQFVTNQITNTLDSTVVRAVNGFPLPITLQNIYVGSESITFSATRT